jgi:hypothetical protein
MTALMGLNRGNAQHQDKERREEDRAKTYALLCWRREMEKQNPEIKKE